jgi:excisionase family DNA binding protein
MLLTFKQAGEHLATSERSIRRLVDAGKISFVQVTPGSKRIDPEELEAYKRRMTKCHGTAEVTGGTRRRKGGASALPSGRMGEATARALGLSGLKSRLSSESAISENRPSMESSGGKIVSFPMP